MTPGFQRTSSPARRSRGKRARISLSAIGASMRLTGSRVADEHRIVRGTLHRALVCLLANEGNVLRNDRDRPSVCDTLAGEWLRRRWTSFPFPVMSASRKQRA
jgi:hypothetical protein